MGNLAEPPNNRLRGFSILTLCELSQTVWSPGGDSLERSAGLHMCGEASGGGGHRVKMCEITHFKALYLQSVVFGLNFKLFFMKTKGSWIALCPLLPAKIVLSVLLCRALHTLGRGQTIGSVVFVGNLAERNLNHSWHYKRLCSGVSASEGSWRSEGQNDFRHSCGGHSQRRYTHDC